MTIAPAAGDGVDTNLLPGVDGVDDLVNANLESISDIISTFKQIADEASEASQTLAGKTGGVTWTGPAADAFHSTAGKLPSQLNQVATSYSQAATALESFYQEVETAQPQIISVLQQLATDHGNLSTAQGNLSSAQTAQTNANNAVNNPPKGTTSTQTATNKTNLDNANTSVSQYSGQVSNLQDDINGLVARGKQIAAGFVQSRTATASAVKNAAGSAPHESFWDHLLGDVEGVVSAYINFEKDIWKGVEDVATVVGKGLWTTIKSIGNLPDDIVQVCEHPLSLTAWTHLAEGVVALGTVALMVTGIGEVALGGELAADVAVGATEDAAEDATEDAVSDAVSDATSDATDDAATTSTKARLADRLAKINKVANNEESGAGKVWSQAQKVVNYGSQAEGEYDDIKDGNWKGALEGAAMFTAMDVGSHYSEKLVGKVTGATQAEHEAGAAATFDRAVAKGDGTQFDAFKEREPAPAVDPNAPKPSLLQRGQAGVKSYAGEHFSYGTESTLTHGSAKDLVSAAGIKTGALGKGEFQNGINSINTKNLVQSTTHALNTKKVIANQIGKSIDGQMDTGKESLSDKLKDKYDIDYTTVSNVG